MQSDHANSSRNGTKFKKFAKVGGVLAIAVVAFLFGVGVGGGQIVFDSTAHPGNKRLPENLNYQAVEQAYDVLKDHYDGQLDEAKLLDGLKKGLADATGDPYTQYFNTKEAKSFEDELNGAFSGIGAELGKNEDKNLIIVSPIEGFPASKAGLRPQDVIVSIDGQSAANLTIDEAVGRIRGAKGTKVTLRILRNKSEDLTITITREDIKVPSVTWELLDGGVGYIKVRQFGPDTATLMGDAAMELKAQGVKSVLLDLRGNPGGLLDAAVKMAGFWLPHGKVVLQEKRGGVVVQTFTSEASGTPAFTGTPTVVLINPGSASASEIVAGALRDNNVATLYGEKSYGKGSVQEIRDLPGGGELKVTVARWYRPNGQNIDKKGIKPDTEVKMTDQDYEQGHDPQKDAALQFLRKHSG